MHKCFITLTLLTFQIDRGRFDSVLTGAINQTAAANHIQLTRDDLTSAAADKVSRISQSIQVGGFAISSLNGSTGEPKVLSRRKRSLLSGLPTGSSLAVDFSLSVPIDTLKGSSSTFDIAIPFTFEMPSTKSAIRRVEDDHATVYEMAENFISRFGMDGKACVLRTICELAESRGEHHDGLVGKTMETILLLDYSMSDSERLYEYIAARTYGEHHGHCDKAYPQCPYSLFQFLDSGLLDNMV